MYRNKSLEMLVAGVVLLGAACGWAQNEPPSVDAGRDAVAYVGRYYTIGGQIVDDGKPERKLSIRWTKVSGPGEVSIRESAKFVISGGIGVPPTNPIEVAMSGSAACFTNTGTYVLRLSADDMELSTSDDVSIKVVPAYGTIEMLSEDFAATNITSLTSGVWTVQNNGNGGEWVVDAATERIEATCDVGSSQDSWLISPVVDCSSYSNTSLELTESFESASYDFWSHGYVLGSIDGGASWSAFSHELHSYPVGTSEEETSEQTVTLDMSWADGQPTVKIAWRHYANDASWWRISEVHLLSDLPGKIVPDTILTEPAETNRYSVGIPTEPGKVYIVEYTDQALSTQTVWSTFADQSNGVGRYQATNETWGSFTFVDDMGPSTSGGAPVDGTRYYRIRIEDVEP